MALKMLILSSSGIEIQDSYIKVTNYSCNIENKIHARLCAYVSKELADNGASPIEGSEDVLILTADYSDEAVNTKKQIYEYAKTLEKYSEAVDC